MIFIVRTDMAKIKPLLKQVSKVQDVLQTTDWVVGVIYTPKAIESIPFWKDLDQNGPYIFSFMANTVSLPSIQTQTAEINLYGYKVKVPLETQWSGELSITFFEDQNVKSTQAVREWFKTIHEYNGNVRVSSETYGINAYKAIIDISLHTHAAVISQEDNPDVTLKVPLTYRVYGVFPTNVSFPELTSQKSGEPLMLNVSFAYDYFEVITS